MKVYLLIAQEENGDEYTKSVYSSEAVAKVTARDLNLEYKEWYDTYYIVRPMELLGT